MEDLASRVKERARELGFDLVGITGVEPSAFAAEYRDWIAQGHAGEMAYLTRNVERRLDPRELLPDARSIIVVGMNYYTEEGNNVGALLAAPKPGLLAAPDNNVAPNPGLLAAPSNNAALNTNLTHNPQSTIHNRQSTIDHRAVFARYARGDDYHDVMTGRLKELLAFVKAQAGPDFPGADGRVYVDAGPVLEREVAQRAGLGWFGKNTMLINTRRGSYFFLGEIVTNVALVVDEPALGGCGTCRKCLDACPTGALLEPYKLDARRCLSYLTIELKGEIPEEFRPALAEAGNRIYGCDICQEVCPFNERRAAPTDEPAYQPREITDSPRLVELLLLSEAEFQEKFKGSPVKRAKRRGLLRNVAAVLCTRDDAEAIAALEHAGNDPEPLVREQAAWSLEAIRARKAK